MRHIERLPEPDILKEKHDEWQEKFEQTKKYNPKARPDSSKYGNPKIRKDLESCSYGKCFYCESMLSGSPKEIDHFIEVAIDPKQAYTWTNLYLSCSNCNDKADHNAIPVNTALDPCRDSDEEIQANITFEDEYICSQQNSQKGLNTIRKYHLRADLLDMKRGKWLRKIMKDIIDIQNRMRIEGRHLPTNDEQQRIKRYMQPDQPYSLMSKIYIETNFDYLLGNTEREEVDMTQP